MKAEIIDFYGFAPHYETDHTEKQMGNIIGAAHYRVRFPDGTETDENTGLRPGENNDWNVKVILAAQAWRDAGGVIPEWFPPTPEVVRQEMEPLTARQFRLGLVHAGISEAEVATVIAALPDDAARQIADIEWQMATEFQRTHPLIVDLGVSFGFTPEQIDDLWSYFLTI